MLDHKTVFRFVRKCWTVFQSGCTIWYSHQQQIEHYCCWMYLPAIGIVWVWNFSHSNLYNGTWLLYKYAVISWQWCWAYFHMLIFYQYIFYIEETVHIFKIIFISFLIIEFWVFLYVLNISPLSDVCFADIYFQSITYPFIFLIVSFTEVLNLIRFGLLIFLHR